MAMYVMTIKIIWACMRPNFRGNTNSSWTTLLVAYNYINGVTFLCPSEALDVCMKPWKNVSSSESTFTTYASDQPWFYPCYALNVCTSIDETDPAYIGNVSSS